LSKSQNIPKSGITVTIKQKRKKIDVDILDLSDEQFISLLYNTLKSFTFEGHKVSDVLIERALRAYLNATIKDPDSVPLVRVTAIMTFEEMGKRFVKDEEQWKICLKHFGFVKQTKKRQKKKLTDG
jgi:hypothetical protein